MKIFKRIVAVVLILTVAAGFCGCKERNKLSDLSIIEGLGVDYENDEYYVTVQSLNLAKEGNGAEALSGNVTMNTGGSGKNISDAIMRVSESLSKELFFGQSRILVFGFPFAKDYLNESIDYLLRSVDSRADIAVCISKSTAAEIMNSKEYDALIPSQAVQSLLKEGEHHGFGAYVTSSELLNMYIDKTSDIYLPVLEAREECVNVYGIAVYSGNNISDILTDKSILGFLILQGKACSSNFIIENEKFGKIGIKVIKTKTKSKVYAKGSDITLNSKIKIELMLDEVEKGATDKLSDNDVREITALAEKEIQGYCYAAFRSCVAAKSDALRIGERLAKDNPKAYEQLSDDWDNRIEGLRLDASVECKIKKLDGAVNGN